MDKELITNSHILQLSVDEDDDNQESHSDISSIKRGRTKGVPRRRILRRNFVKKKEGKKDFPKRTAVRG